MAINNVFTYGACALLGISMEVLVWRKLLFTVVVTAGKLAAIFLAWYIGHLWKGRKSSAVRGEMAAIHFVVFYRIRSDALYRFFKISERRECIV